MAGIASFGCSFGCHVVGESGGAIYPLTLTLTLTLALTLAGGILMSRHF